MTTYKITNVSKTIEARTCYMDDVDAMSALEIAASFSFCDLYLYKEKEQGWKKIAASIEQHIITNPQIL